MSDGADARFMRYALALGRRGEGCTWPNPAVGCVLVRSNEVVSIGWTQKGGRPHAETEALARAGERAKGATAYVTLEPCSNWGKTPPCCKSLIEAGIARVVIGCVDPDPRVNGKGIDWLRQAGIEVTLGVLEDQARVAHLGLYRRIIDKRPMVSLKIAQSLDGRIATASGHSQWITSSDARRLAHRMRATHDAVMIGSGTALADDPTLTCRLPGLEHRSPVRVVADRRLRLSLQSNLAKTAKETPLWLLTSADAEETRIAAFEELGATVIRSGDAEIQTFLRQLAERGLTRLMVEGGSILAQSLLSADLVDHLWLFEAPKTLGGDGRPSVAPLGLERVDDAPQWRLLSARRIGPDQLQIFERSEQRT